MLQAEGAAGFRANFCDTAGKEAAARLKAGLGDAAGKEAAAGFGADLGDAACAEQSDIRPGGAQRRRTAAPHCGAGATGSIRYDVI